MCGLNSSLAWRMPREVVLHAEHVHVVLELVAERLEHVVLGPPRRRREVVPGHVVGRHQVVVHQDEDAKFFHGREMISRFVRPIDVRDPRVSIRS